MAHAETLVIFFKTTSFSADVGSQAIKADFQILLTFCD